jgi:hypothetical protein
MRTLDPFAFFFDHASAIPGYGGNGTSPDLRYCFHTHYVSVRPGPAQFYLRLEGPKANFGELTLRVHGFGSDGSRDAVLVAGSRLNFDGGPTDDIELAVRFRAVRDVNYAFYGYFSEPSDLSVSGLAVDLAELEEEGDGSQSFEEDVATSALAANAVGSSASQSSALVLGRAAGLKVPVSQDCTIDQLRSRDFAEVSALQPETPPLRLWSEVVCRQVLMAYGGAVPGTRGLIIGGSSPLLAAFYEEHEMALHTSEWHPEDGLDALAPDGHVDVLISWLDMADLGDPKMRFEIFAEMLSRVLIGGLALICLRYDPETVLLSSTTASKAQRFRRNEIGQWVLRLIGSGFSAAPLAFAPLDELARDEAGRAAIVLVLRRL